MNALNDACTKGVNPKMILMSESYGGWGPCALADKWKDFSPTESHIELQGCIAQAADLNLGEWKNRHHSIGELGVVATFAENLLDVASITEL
jgi:hypothetical protein